MTDPTDNETPEIRIEAVDFMVCPGCGVEIDTTELPALADIECPQCHAPVKVAGRLANFRILDLIGAGGMGAVYLAQDDALDRRVAIKVMLSSVGKDPEMLATFRREAQAAARLNHPHVVQIYSFGEENSQPYIVMELVNAGKLDAMISSGGRLDPAFVMRVGAEIAEGLAAAQAANLLHGDIKPENILFDEKHSAKLVDFGIASMLTSKSGAPDEIWGTPFYIAPEKVRKHGNDVRSDIYSLGATLYHALAGKPPFDGPTVKDVIQARFGRKPQPLPELCPGIDPRVVAIVDRMMSENPFQRYPNYTSLLGDMRRYLDTVSDAAKRGPRRLFAAAGAAAGAASATGPTTGSAPASDSSASPAAASAADGTSGRKKIVIVKKATPSMDAPMPETPSSPQTWTCSCGQAGNQGKFCMNCGKSAPSAEWTCAKCGQGHNKGKFCMNCGAPAPDAAGEPSVSPASPASPADEPSAPPAAAPAATAHTGRKGIVIRSGALNAVPVTRGAAPVSVADAVQAGEEAAEAAAAQAEPQQAGNAKLMRGCLIGIFALIGVVILGAGGFLVWHVSKTKKAAAAQTRLFEEAQGFEKEIQALQDPIDHVVKEIQKYDDSVNKDIRDVANQIARALPGTKWERPSLEPPPPSAEPAPAPEDSAAPADGAAAPDAAAPEATAPDLPAEDASPDLGEPAEPLHPLIAEAAKMLGPAKAIRAKLREAEAIRDRDPNTFGGANLKRDTTTKKDHDDRKAALEARRADKAKLDESLTFCHQQEIAFKRLRPGFDKALARVREEAVAAAAAKEREEAAAKEREKAEAAAAKERGKAEAEIEKAKDFMADQKDLVAKHDYARALEALERKRAQFFTADGKAAFECQVEKLSRLASLKEFLAKDLQGKGLVTMGIVDADAEGFTQKNGQKVAWDTMPLGTWVKLAQSLLAARDPARAINTLEHGDQLFNTALFMLAHGAGNDNARRLAVDYAKKALEKRSALRKDVPRLMPEIKDEVFAAGEDEGDAGF